MMKMVQSAGDHQIRKGPWTEQEDLQLVCYVGLFGGRRWDFIAKVSGLNRTGKSCRFRWVNYLHPGLKRGRMTPQEERVVLQLHSRWGNRWSKIARKLPGRTDNEIKNYWRTHMRKEVQEMRKRDTMISMITTMVESPTKSQNIMEGDSSNLNGKGSCVTDFAVRGDDVSEEEEEEEEDYSMDQIWKEIASPEEHVNSTTSQVFYRGTKEEATCSFSSCPPLMASPLWELGSESLWTMDEGETNMLAPMVSVISTNEHKPGRVM
ncbi:SANT/Myb domain [Macleaya cordata]|uniref:SANT/Myb domain n=1 Tax=Macleaya cordata TaxID=56857 RepID=A0A200R6D6_MACCD|nr:SANT/Myb domain [Macleaya cordata]